MKFLRTCASKALFILQKILGTNGLVTDINQINKSLVEVADLQISEHSPIDSFILSNFRYRVDGHFNPHYKEWRIKRIRKILEIYDLDYFKGKRILEIGGGLGDIGAFFADIGGDVLSLEGRRINRNISNLRFRNIKNFKSIEGDLEADFEHLGRFDLIINFGTIEVVKNLDILMGCCAKLSDDILIETMVCDSTDPSKILFTELTSEGNDNPMSGVSARPSPAYIEKFHSDRGFTVQRYFDSNLNTDKHCYDWKHLNDDNIIDSRRRFWRFQKSAR